jgi:hypothetical protein
MSAANKRAVSRMKGINVLFVSKADYQLLQYLPVEQSNAKIEFVCLLLSGFIC